MLQGPAGKHIKKTEQGTLGPFEKGRQGHGIDTRRGDMDPDPVNRQHGQGKPDLLLQLRNLGYILDAADHCFSSGLLNFKDSYISSSVFAFRIPEIRNPVI